MFDFLISDGGLFLMLICLALAVGVFVWLTTVEEKEDLEEFQIEQRCRKCKYYEKCKREERFRLSCQSFVRDEEEL